MPSAVTTAETSRYRKAKTHRVGQCRALLVTVVGPIRDPLDFVLRRYVVKAGLDQAELVRDFDESSLKTRHDAEQIRGHVLELLRAAANVLRLPGATKDCKRKTRAGQ